MIVGRFGDTTGRPYVEAIVWFERLKVRMNVSFLVDTGAELVDVHSLARAAATERRLIGAC